jgi:hypothetical protein
MIKVYALIPKRPDITDEHFHAHWREPHGRLALNIKPIRRYTQAHRVPYAGLGYAPGPYEGIAEVWFDTLEIALGLGQDPDYQRDLVPDELKFIDVPNLKFLLTEEQVTIFGPAIAKNDSYFKIMQILRRRDGMTAAAFRDAWSKDDPGNVLVTQLHAVRHQRNCAAAGTEPEAGTGYDAVREMWWRSAADFEAARRAAPAAWRQLMEPAIADATATIVAAVDEYRVLWP